MKKRSILYCLLLFISIKAASQNVSSPYSILGIGDIDNNSYGRFAASGNAAVSRREASSYNFSNPASLTAIPFKSINFDLNFRGRSSTFKPVASDTFSSYTKDFILKRITLAFKVTPKTAIAFGLKPFSSVNYQFVAASSVSNGNEVDYLKYTEGTGGINQVYFSAAKEIRPRLSVGATLSWLFGSLQNNVEYYNADIDLDIVKKETDFYHGVGLKAGLQYYSRIGKKWQQTFGLTVDAYTNLKGEKTVEYLESDVSIKTLSPEGIRFKMPVIAGIGYSIGNRKGLSYHIQGTYQKWATKNLHYNSIYIKDAYSLHAGIEYSKKQITQNSVREKSFWAAGIKMEQSYLVTSNNHLTDYAITLGAGKNISRFLSLSAGLDIGTRGKNSLQQIQENYYQFNVGLTLKDFWFGTKKMGRFR